MRIIRKKGKRKRNKPSICIYCGEQFLTYSVKMRKHCFKDECEKKHKNMLLQRAKDKARKLKEQKTREEFSKGRIWILDMESWEWRKEIR